MNFDPDLLLAALPHRPIGNLPVGTKIPGRKSFGDMSDYNGFTGRERLRTHGVSKWLRAMGVMLHEGNCSVCMLPTDQLHAEDYFDISSWINMCRSCHGKLHKRFNHWDAWIARLDHFEIGDSHWARLVSKNHFDLASLLRQRLAKEPLYADFVELP